MSGWCASSHPVSGCDRAPLTSMDYGSHTFVTAGGYYCFWRSINPRRSHSRELGYNWILEALRMLRLQVRSIYTHTFCLLIHAANSSFAAKNSWLSTCSPSTGVLLGFKHLVFAFSFLLPLPIHTVATPSPPRPLNHCTERLPVTSADSVGTGQKYISHGCFQVAILYKHQHYL